METYKSKDMITCGHCEIILRHKHFDEHLYRRHPAKSREYAKSEITNEPGERRRIRRPRDFNFTVIETLAVNLQFSTVEKEKLKIKAQLEQKQKELAIEAEKICLRRKQAEEQEKLEKLKKSERKRKRRSSHEQGEFCANRITSVSTPANLQFVALDHNYFPSESQRTDMADGGNNTGVCATGVDLSTGQVDEKMNQRPCERLTPMVIERAMDEETMRRNFRMSRSLEDIQKHSQIFDYCDEDKSFNCIACSEYQTGAKITYCSKSTDTESMTLNKIRELKKKLLGHMYSSTRHLSAVRAIHQARRTEDSVRSIADEEDYTAGMIVGRAAYGCIKKGRSYQDFEMDMCMRAADNCMVGDINHKQTAATTFGTGEPPPFSVVCDKMTPSRHTLHNIGIVSPVDNGRLCATYLEARPSKDGTGVGLAREVNTALRRVFSADDVRPRFRGMAVDGAYINCNIKEHILDTLEIPQNARESYAVHWDPAHQVELAVKTSQRQHGKTGRIGVEWIRSTVSTVNQLAMKYGRGKGWNELNDSHILNQCEEVASGSGTPAARITKLQNFSSTRFTSFAHRAISAVRKNWASLYDCAKNNDKLSLTNPNFILGLCGLDDMYSTIGKTSMYLQSSRIYPWNVGERIDDCLQNLNDMSSQLELSTENMNATQFPALVGAITELKDHGTYKGRQLLEHTSCAESLECEILKVKKDLAENIKCFSQDLARRHEKTSEKATQLAREVFTLRKILERPPGDVPPAVIQLYDMYINSSFISEAKTDTEIQDEYRAFLDAVFLQSGRSFNAGGEFISQEEQIYAHFLSDSEPAKDFRTIARMLASASCQTQCEVVTEGWGSVLDSLAKRKVNLDPEKLSQETFIKLNGPPPSSKSNGIIEGALDRHFGGRHRWHFIRSSRSIQTKVTSRVVSRLSTTKEGFPLDD